MSDLLRTILKWIIIIALTALIIMLVIHIANKNSKKKNQPVQAVEKIKLDDTNEEEETTGEGENTLMIDLGDTASTTGISIWIGIIILGTTSYYIYRNRQENE